jgi:glycosyltransferase involved in cell wall biosynthesis
VRFRCVIVGKGELRPELKRLISALDLEQDVELAGALPREKLLELFPRASVLAAPCVVGSDGNRDGLPTVLTEAMALKVPVVATPVTGIPELVEDGRTGLIVPEGDPAALAAAIRRLLEDRETARRLAEAGRARVERDFDLHANVARLRTLFEESVAR